MHRLKNSVLIQDGFAVHGHNLSDCEFSFSARAPEGADEVQIWAGIRCRDRDSRYVFALRGGHNNDAYVARYAPDGQSRFLGIAPLDFHPAPGNWYKLRAVAQGDRILIYVNGEDLPRLNVQDDSQLWSEGTVSLGGGYLPVEFRQVSVRHLSTTGKVAANRIEQQIWKPASVDKAQLRAQQRSAYRPMVLDASDEPRIEFSLDGNWLFIPDQELAAKAQPQSHIFDDGNWHVMEVPNFWDSVAYVAAW